MHRKPKTSQYKYINFEAETNRFRPRIKINGQQVNLGSYDTERDAVTALNACQRAYFNKKALIQRVHSSSMAPVFESDFWPTTKPERKPQRNIFQKIFYFFAGE